MRARHLNSLEDSLNVVLECCGGLERSEYTGLDSVIDTKVENASQLLLRFLSMRVPSVRGTPLPIVYVTHLRTFLIFSLLLFPYVWGPSLGWVTIPFVAATAFAWLGIEGAAAESESPFRADRVNALDMDGYCLGFLGVVKQQLVNHADRHIIGGANALRR
jgi:predicted membrane chloride channel (bestrophin family)